VSPGGLTSLAVNYRRFGNYGAALELVSEVVHEELGEDPYFDVFPFLLRGVDSVRLGGGPNCGTLPGCGS